MTEAEVKTTIELAKISARIERGKYICLVEKRDYDFLYDEE